MQIKIKFPGDFTVFSPDDAAPFLKALTTSQSIRTEGWGDNEKLHACKEKPTIELIDDLSFLPVPEPLIELQTRLRASEKSWIDYYNKFNASEKKVKELEEKLASIQSAAT